MPVRLYVELTREGIRQCRNIPWLAPHIVEVDQTHGYVDITIDRTEMDFITRYFTQLSTASKVLLPQEVTDRIRAFLPRASGTLRTIIPQQDFLLA